MQEFGITDAVIAINDGSCGFPALRDLAKPFSYCGFCIEEIERGESDARSKSVVPGSSGAIEWRNGRH
jgi:hypothetical protein